MDFLDKEAGRIVLSAMPKTYTLGGVRSAPPRVVRAANMNLFPEEE